MNVIESTCFLFQAVGLIRREKFILVATMDDCLQCFSSKGKRIWSQKLPASIKCLESMDIPSRGVQFTAVALENRQVLVFNDKHVVDCFRYLLTFHSGRILVLDF